MVKGLVAAGGWELVFWLTPIRIVVLRGWIQAEGLLFEVLGDLLGGMATGICAIAVHSARDLVIVGILVKTARGNTRAVEAGNDLVLTVDNLHVSVDAYSSERSEHRKIGMDGVIRTGANGVHVLGILSEILVDAFFAQLVVSKDRRLERFWVGAHVGGKILEGFAFVYDAVPGCLGARFELFSQTGKRIAWFDFEVSDVAPSAVFKQFNKIVVEERIRARKLRSLCVDDQGVKLLKVKVFGHEALAVSVDIEAGLDARCHGDRIADHESIYAKAGKD